MDDTALDNIEVAPPSVVLAAAREFAAALAETPQFQAFEQVAERFRLDEGAQQAHKAYQAKQSSWRALIMLNALNTELRGELESLRSAFFDRPLVQEYMKAQNELIALCQTLGDALSDGIGLNYAAACGVSCCG
jgi:cell fate (sporulation/competence/biofilm development) regulator YlbF (YheA/YmcA/DUF963 family)